VSILLSVVSLPFLYLAKMLSRLIFYRRATLYIPTVTKVGKYEQREKSSTIRFI
jgi:hypothetical protein